jgi:S1-C subfamily serine protease
MPNSLRIMSYCVINVICVLSLPCVTILLLSLQVNEDGHALLTQTEKINADGNNKTSGSIVHTKLTKTVSDNTTSQQTSSSLTNIFREAENSVVQITGQPNASTKVIGHNGFIIQTTAFGTGFVYDHQGHIITNNHIIEGAGRINVKLADGNVFGANVIGTDSLTDLAVLQIADNFSNERLSPLNLANSSLLQVGQEVAAIGNPFGIRNLMTQGIISGLGLLLPNNQTGFSLPDVIVTDVPLNPGNSGGPLLNMKGEVIGINTAITTPTQFSELSYSISSNIIKKIVPQLIAYGRYTHPWLGITASASFNPGLERGTTGLPKNFRGVAIMSLQPGSPAAKANLRPITTTHIGDIIMAIDGYPINRFEDIINYIESTKSVDDTIVLKLLRNGTTIQNIGIKLSAVISVHPKEKQNITTITTLPTLSKLAMKNWTKIISLSNSNITSQGPRLAASRNNVYAVWEESYYQNGNNRIMFTESANRGDTFSNPLNLTSDIKIDSETPSIDASGNNVYVVWTDNSTGNFDIFFIKSTDGGNTFSKPVNLSNDPGVSYFPRIALDRNNGIYIVWTDNSLGNYNIMFTKSINGGDTFSKPITLTNNNKNEGVSNFPNIAVSAANNNSVYVVWSHKNNTDFDPSNTANQTQTYDVFLTKSTDHGNTFSKSVNLSNDPSNSQSPAVATVSGNVYVVWTDNFIGAYEIFLTKSTDDGSTFSKATVISSNVARSISPSIAAYGNNAYVTWSDNTFGNSEIFFTYSTDNGTSFNMPVSINNDTGISDLAQITTKAAQVGNGGDGGLYLAWADNVSEHSEIYFTKTRP